MALRRRKIRQSKNNKESIYKSSLIIELECKNGCGNTEMVPSTIKAVTCAYCVQKMLDNDILAPERKRPGEPTRPRGWQFMKHYVDFNGVEYSKGKIVESKNNSAKRIKK